MYLKEEVIKLLKEAKADEAYHNVHLVRGLLDVLSDVYSFEDDELDEWCQSLWEM